MSDEKAIEQIPAFPSFVPTPQDLLLLQQMAEEQHRQREKREPKCECGHLFGDHKDDKCGLCPTCKGFWRQDPRAALRERVARFLDSYDYPDHAMRTPDQARPWILERMYSDPRFHVAVTMLTNEMERYAQERHEGR